MVIYIYSCILLMTIVYLNTINAIPASSTNVEAKNKKFSDPCMLEQYDIGFSHILVNRQYNDDHFDNNGNRYKGQPMRKKWAKYYSGAQSLFTTAFPVLIRMHRWIVQEQ